MNMAKKMNPQRNDLPDLDHRAGHARRPDGRRDGQRLVLLFSTPRGLASGEGRNYCSTSTRHPDRWLKLKCRTAER